MVTHTTVVAVIATYNRSDVLDETLRAIETQHRPPDKVVVVDNASSDDTLNMLVVRHPDVVVLPLPDNRGASGGLAAGFDRAFAVGADVVWVCDDDTTPAPHALGTLLLAFDRVGDADLGILALSGGSLRGGMVRHLAADQLSRYEAAADSPAMYSADFVVYDGGLVTRRAYDVAGTPRPDFFHDFGDLEYAMRVREHGLRLLVLDAVIAERANLGSGGAGGSTPPWRGYYRTRNQLRAALDRRSPQLIVGWLRRDTKLLVAALLYGDQRWRRVKLRLLGVWHGCTNRLGRRIDPDNS